ncbi:MAG: large conductance mechanosensitive channel protein MscL [Clostridiales bacterium]|nr:large conductance mechanosensitive channel protein MscL [Clostridiales bacterium]
MKKFFEEFKKFITRGNIVDMAVGVTVGSAFTAIVNGLTNNILKPLINWILALIMGANSLTEVFTPLKMYEDPDTGVVDLSQSIYIDWGAFINAVINFVIIAFVLFVIVKTFNSIKEKQDKLEEAVNKYKPTKEDKKAMKAEGVKLYDRDAVKAWLDAKREKEAQLKAEEEAKAAEQARLDRLANPTTEDLLKEILATLKKNA